jgi:hypothetical protein
VIELGCGTGYISAWLAGRGATPVGIEALVESRPPDGSTTHHAAYPPEDPWE